MIGKRKKIICFLLTAFLMAGILSGCFDRIEIDDYAYAIALGFDKGSNNALRLTLQIAVPSKIGGGGGGNEGGEGGGKGGSTTLTTVEAPTLYSALNLINNYISRKINMAHAKVIVFSEELAKEDISKYIFSMMRGREFRGDIFVMVAKGKAEEFIKSVQPEIEVNPAKYYEYSQVSYKHTGFTAPTSLTDFYLKLNSSAFQPIATLAGVSKYEKTEDISTKESTFGQKGSDRPMEGDYVAGSIPKAGNLKSEVMGVAVFVGGRMVGELDGEETMFHLMTTGDFENTYVSIPDPLAEGKYVVLSMKSGRNPKRSVKLEGNTPVINVQLRLEADIVAIEAGTHYENAEQIKKLEAEIGQYLKEGMHRYLEKTAREFNADICGFGMEMKKKTLTWPEWQSVKWVDIYRNSIFQVGVDVKIRRPGLLVKTVLNDEMNTGE